MKPVEEMTLVALRAEVERLRSENAERRKASIVAAGVAQTMIDHLQLCKRYSEHMPERIPDVVGDAQTYHDEHMGAVDVRLFV